MKFFEARAILDEECMKADGKPASTNRSPAKTQNEAAADEGWWIENAETMPPHDSLRTKAYLRAYVRIAGPRPLFAKGIPLEDGFILPDRGVMKTLLLAGCVTFVRSAPPRFEITDRGRALLAED